MHYYVRASNMMRLQVDWGFSTFTELPQLVSLGWVQRGPLVDADFFSCYYR